MKYVNKKKYVEKKDISFLPFILTNNIRQYSPKLKNEYSNIKSDICL